MDVMKTFKVRFGLRSGWPFPNKLIFVAMLTDEQFEEGADAVQKIRRFFPKAPLVWERA